MMLKFSDTVQMSIKVSDSEKKIGAQAERFFLEAINILSNFKDHLNIIKNAFAGEEQISEKVLHDNRGLIYRYKKKIKENFGIKFKPVATKAIKLLSYFDSDSHVDELISSFGDCLKEIQKLVVELMDEMDNLSDPQFKDKISSNIDLIFQKIEDIDQLVRDRVIDFIDNHILVKNDFKEEQVDLSELEESLIEILQDRNLISATKVNKREQSLNPADNQRISTPTDIREIPENDDVGKFMTPLNKG